MSRVRYIIVGLLVSAFVVIEFLIGGTRLVFSLPAYALLALAALLTLGVRRSTLPQPIGVCIASTGVLFAYVIIRQLTSPVEYLARMDLLMVLACLMIYGIMAFYLTNPKHRWGLAVALLSIALFQTSLAVIQFFTGDKHAILDFLRLGGYGFRASGMYICPNHLAGFLEIVVLFAVAMAFWSRRGFWLRLIAVYTAMVSLIAVILTGSRGGWASMSIGLLVFAILSLMVLKAARPERFRMAATLTTVFAVVIIGGLAFFVAKQYPLQSRSSKATSDAQFRFTLWRGALEQFQENPIIGTGSRTYDYYGLKFRPSDILGTPEYVHNDYLQFLAEFGVVGSALFIFFFVSHARAGYKAMKRLVDERAACEGPARSDTMALTIATISALAAYACHSVVDFNLHIPANAMLMAFVFGALANPGRILKEEDAPARLPIIDYAGFGVAAIALWMVWAGLRTWPAELYAEKARVAVRDEEFGKGIHFAKEGVQRDSTNPLLWLYLGQAYSEFSIRSDDAMRRKALDAAVTAFSKGLPLYPQNRWLLIGMGEALDGLDRYDEAEPYYARAIAWNPTSADICFFYAKHLRTAGRLSEAEQQFKKSLDLYWNVAALKGLQSLAKAAQLPGPAQQ